MSAKYYFFIVYLMTSCLQATASPVTIQAEKFRPLFSKSSGPILADASNQQSPERIKLGRALFFDPRLSHDKTMSCATCHNPEYGFSDKASTSKGFAGKALNRRTPSIVNAAYLPVLFWDGRAATLEEQAIMPITSAEEMNLPAAELVARIQADADYQKQFAVAYPDEPIRAETIAKAIACFERTVRAPKTRFDEWRDGNENALSAVEKLGLVVFQTSGSCANCHAGAEFTDHSFHDIGVKTQDKGRGELFPRATVLQHAFKTPTLRGVSSRPPYMHNGSEKNLRDVVELYLTGGREHRASVSSEIRPLKLSAGEVDALIAFLKVL